ncbi:AAA family ATPase [Halorientalis regularis]|uniref:MoxR-like ATPase n=1 Tax=Halorientalis regularis TaxID=660518 RepID=A0A1G7T1R1_9EURY|nr:MoxR family ATPase [Halorientalis regularis]SDG29191.1 MoxR-like ATPase [Halorientalis regularis]
MTDPAALYDTVSEEIGKVLIGNETVVESLTISLLTRGHILLEGVPGVAKTTVANLFARATGLDYNRIQMTPDILPADITGTYVYREQTGEFELRKGPVFSNLVVADEINRATPKTQSALLEAMQERHVSIEGETLDLPEPFMVIATQNPIEMEGTFELPEAQRDRFQLKLTVDTPGREDESTLLERFDDDPDLGPAQIEQVVTTEEVLSARETVSEIYIDETVREYVLDIVEATRESPDLEYGASPRASIAFLNTTKARAAIEGRDYVIPDDVKALARQILVHRVVLSTDAELSDMTPADVIDSILETIQPPGRETVENASTRAVGDGGNRDDAA